MRVRFDAKTLRIRSGPVPITEGLYVGNSGNAKLTVSRTGALAFVPEYRAGQLVVIDRPGRADTLPIGTHRFHSPRFSPDGRFIVTSILAPDGSQDLWLVDRERVTMRQITFDSASVEPVWSPDGRRIVCSRKPAARGFGWEIISVAVDGIQEPEVIVPPAVDQLAGGFSADGTRLVFERRGPRSGRDVWTVPLHGERRPQRLLDGPFNEYAPAVSPDGNWLAFVSDESGRDEIYVVSFPQPRGRVQVTFDGGRRPRWASSRELVYRTANGFAAVDLQTSQRTVRVESRGPIFGSGHAALAVPGGEAYGVHPDGDRLVVVSSAPRSGDVMVLLNWQGTGLPAP
jgi:dipeptidyl aminopeptidase/acylaminoacyl peptidase